MTLRRLNKWLTFAWLGVVPISLATGWIYSLAFISACSIYANACSHLAAWRADEPSQKTR